MRLKGYDYTQERLHFITISLKNGDCLLGEAVTGNHELMGASDGKLKTMVLNDAGKMAERWYRELENKFPDKRCHEMVIMPNHIHCIIENLDNGVQLVRNNESGGNIEVKPPARMERDTEKDIQAGAHLQEVLEYKKYNAPIEAMIAWFKTKTTNEYMRCANKNGWKRFDRKLWQYGYTEYIIQSKETYENLVDYMIDNRANWSEY